MNDFSPMTTAELVGWVYANGGPILKHRLAVEFGLGSEELRQPGESIPVQGRGFTLRC